MKIKYIEDKNYDLRVALEMSEKIEMVEEKYKSVDGLFSKRIIEYQESWNKINDIFSEEIEKITKYKWKHKIYNVVLSPFHVGISSLGGNKVIRSVFEDSEDQKRITAHEILMSHLWNIFFDLYPESRKDKNHIFWALNEITTTAILGLEPNIDKLWTDKTKGYDQYLRDYPKLNELKMILKEKYLMKNNFLDYLKEAFCLIEIVKH